MTSRRHLRRYACLLALLAVAAFVASMPTFAPRAEAHSALVRSTPANNDTLPRSPTRVVLYFSEAVERKLTQIQVVDQDEKRVDTNDMGFDDADATLASVGVKRLEPGLYRVKWTNVSRVDGHNLRGSYPFVVLNPDRTFPEGISLDPTAGQTQKGALLPSPWDALLKWIGLLALSITAGASFFVLVVLRPAASFLDDDGASRAVAAGERWLAHAAHVLLPTAFIASTALIVVAVNRFATSPGLWSYLTSIRAGEYRFAQLAAIVLALAAADTLYLSTSRRLRSAAIILLLAAVAAALFAYPLVSHSASERGKFWSLVSDYAHLLAASAWLGALAMLPLFLRWSKREIEQPGRQLLIANVFDRFSNVALLSVIIVLASGAFNGLVEIPNAPAMVETTYGRMLLAKLSLMAPLLAIAGINAVFLKPRLVAAIDGAYQLDATPSPEERDRHERRLASIGRVLPWTIAAEVALVAAVFAAVAVLTQTATARGEIAEERALVAASSKFEQSADTSDLKLALEVTPNRVGLNEYTLEVRNQGDTLATSVTQARLRFNYEDDQSTTPSELVLTRSSGGEYRGTGSYFSKAGNWRIDVTVRRSDGDDVARAFLLPVQRPAGATKTGGGSLDLPFDSFNWNEVVGAALVVAGGVAMLYRRQLTTSFGRAGGRGALGSAAALFVAGAALYVSGGSHASVDPTAGNPVEATTQSVERGRMLFQQNCIVCHGVDGRGDGPQAASLDPAPTDMRGHVPLHDDTQFHNFIANGYPGTAMPAWRDSFSDEDIWNLVNFLRKEFSETLVQ